MTVKLVKVLKNRIIKNKKGSIIKYISNKEKNFLGFGEVYFSEIKYKKTKAENSRFSISVRKNVGNAPCRNHIKRLLKEVIRRKQYMLNHSYDFCFFLKSYLFFVMI